MDSCCLSCFHTGFQRVQTSSARFRSQTQPDFPRSQIRCKPPAQPPCPIGRENLSASSVAAIFSSLLTSLTGPHTSAALLARSAIAALAATAPRTQQKRQFLNFLGCPGSQTQPQLTRSSPPHQLPLPLPSPLSDLLNLQHRGGHPQGLRFHCSVSRADIRR